MQDRRHSFDGQGFYAALDAQRIAKKKTWKQVASETGVTASTLTRMGQGKRPDVDGLAALASWSGIDVRNFYSNTSIGKQEPLSQISTILRADKNLGKQNAEALDALIKSAYEQLRIRDGET